ncbi:helix-turn-helix transcriptional regulator [Prevotella koreensis]|uniref:XRE family transcriptional regulator n=1 Tax=Prevotella koreensis TaxID=2490854 RepID=A0A432LLL2_9BACT|nr:helix-turn-helix transcriptional regulator [Prevotella koreensis]RUL59654.1 XRE family transcriptional regulator [Prevotella koreensis]
MSNNEHTSVANRLKIVLVEQGRTNRWLAEQLGKTEHTVSRWCQNKTQPSISILVQIAQILDVDVRVLIKSTKQ